MAEFKAQPTATQPQGSTELEKGDLGPLNDAVPEAPPPPQPQPQPQAEEDLSGMGEALVFSDDEDLAPGDEDDDILFGTPSFFPEQSVTSGAPFGPGLDGMPVPNESPGARVERIARQFIELPGIPDDARAWAERKLAGQ